MLILQEGVMINGRVRVVLAVARSHSILFLLPNQRNLGEGGSLYYGGAGIGKYVAYEILKAGARLLNLSQVLF